MTSREIIKQDELKVRLKNRKARREVNRVRYIELLICIPFLAFIQAGPNIIHWALILGGAMLTIVLIAHNEYRIKYLAYRIQQIERIIRGGKVNSVTLKQDEVQKKQAAAVLKAGQTEFKFRMLLLVKAVGILLVVINPLVILYCFVHVLNPDAALTIFIAVSLFTLGIIFLLFIKAEEIKMSKTDRLKLKLWQPEEIIGAVKAIINNLLAQRKAK